MNAYPRGMAENIEYRIEHDTMGEVRVPADALYRAQTQRAVENFPISGQTLESAHIRALALVKKAAATANEELKVLDAERAQAIRDAADLVATGKYDAHFPIDVFQTGSGTSSNMNANEVLATLATRSLESKGIEVHPNDHVNASQSSNDVFPTSVHVAVTEALVKDLIPALEVLAESLERKSAEFKDVIELLAEETGLPLTEARNHFEAQANRDGLIEVSGQLRTLAYGLMKISNDIRWMGSGPNTGLGELHIPDLQPGSSIMPGKVNPVICEATIQVAAQVIGNDATIALSSTNGAFELNVGIPVMAANLLQSIRLLANVSRVAAEKMVDGLTANVERCRFLAEASPSTVTPLNKLIGYEAAAKIAKYSVAHKVTVREAVVALGYVERGEVTEEQLDAALDVTKMLGNF